MKLIKFILLIIIIVILVTGLVPLNLYYSSIEKNIKPLKLKEISGSLLKGDAKQLSYIGLPLGQVKWMVYPSSYDQATLDLTLFDSAYELNGKVRKTPNHEYIQDLKGSIDIPFILNKINQHRGKFSGYAKIDFDRIEFDQGVPQRIEGEITTKELMIIKPIKKSLGEIRIEFTSDNPQIIVGQVNSKSQVLNVSGAIYIHKNRRWEVKLTLIPSPGEYEIQYALQGIGNKRRGGGRSLNLAGFY